MNFELNETEQEYICPSCTKETTLIIFENDFYACGECGQKGEIYYSCYDIKDVNPETEFEKIISAELEYLETPLDESSWFIKIDPFGPISQKISGLAKQLEMIEAFKVDAKSLATKLVLQLRSEIEGITAFHILDNNVKIKIYVNNHANHMHYLIEDIFGKNKKGVSFELTKVTRSIYLNNDNVLYVSYPEIPELEFYPQDKEIETREKLYSIKNKLKLKLEKLHFRITELSYLELSSKFIGISYDHSCLIQKLCESCENLISGIAFYDWSIKSFTYVTTDDGYSMNEIPLEDYEWIQIIEIYTSEIEQMEANILNISLNLNLFTPIKIIEIQPSITAQENITDVMFESKKIDTDPYLKGHVAETDFRDWMDSHGYFFIHLQQDAESIAKAFKRISSSEFADLKHNPLKRPDFLIQLSGYGTIVADVKCQEVFPNHKSNGVPSLTISEIEFTKARNFENEFNLSWWWVFKVEKKWLFINTKKVNEYFKNPSTYFTNTSIENKPNFAAIPVSHLTEQAFGIVREFNSEEHL